ncbi:MAG: RelA/SpoT family protein [Patescibacteria group bacterium]
MEQGVNSLDRLFETIRANYPNTELKSIRDAFEFARTAHEGQMRKSGEPYFNHAYHTSFLLAEWRMSPAMIMAGMLHDVPEDTKHTVEDVRKNFGEDIASMVEGETKLSQLKYRGVERYAENLRKMFFSIAQDVRIVIVKFADRIDNMRTLSIFPEAKRHRIALETLEIYAAIANRLGMGIIRKQLEDLSFQYIYPTEYAWVTGLVKEQYAATEPYVEKMKNTILDDLRQANINILDVHSRTKGFYSLYKKLLKHDRDFKQIYDIVACRVIVSTVADCYSVLGVIHNRWKPLKGRIKDYIAQPKPNGYQSLHTTVFCDNGQIVEFQIRNQEMHEQSQYGLAAHWFYKEQGKSSPFEKKYTAWLKELGKFQKEMADSSKFLETLESLKIDLFQNRIFVFTPNGDVIDLPEGATAVDFAYAIHTDMGDHCTAAKVNDRITPLDAPLLSSDVIEIVTDKKRKSPSVTWLKSVKTRHARSKIREQIKKTRLGELLLHIAPTNINGKKNR